MRRRASSTIAGLLFAGLLAACGDGGNDGDAPQPTPTVVRPGPGPAQGTITLAPISATEYDALADQAALQSANTTGCQGDPLGGTVQVCQLIDAAADPVTWIAIGGNAAASAPSDGAQAVLFYGNDADGALAEASAEVASSPTVSGYWKATWQAPPVSLQLGTTSNFVAGFLIGGTQLTEVCMLPFGATTYTCMKTALLASSPEP